MKGRLIVSALFVAGVGLAVACSVDVDISKKACPCGTGYVCDTAQNLCVVTLSSAQPQPTTAQPERRVCDPCPCATSADCTDKARPFCEPTSKTCVDCDPKNDTCADDRYCSEKFQCTPGCRTDAACAKLSPGSPTCAVDKHQCVQCIDDSKCQGDEKCGPSGTCVKKCTTGGAACPGGSKCCGELCIDISKDRFNCGECGNVCKNDNGTPSCAASKCSASCADGFKTCGGGVCATNVGTDLQNCGDCGNGCSNLQNVEGARCAVGKCTYLNCAPLFVDLDGDPTNGCEAECGRAQNRKCCPVGAAVRCYDGKKCRPADTGKLSERDTCE